MSAAIAGAVGAAGAGLLSAGASVANTLITNNFNKKEAEKQREWNEEMMDKQNEWSLNMWNKTNEYNTPEAQVQRLRDAGLNPLYYGLDGSSANGLESAQPLGYERASMSGMDNPVAAGLGAYTQMKSLQKDIELKNAQIDKLGAETENTKLDNTFKERIMDAKVEEQQLENDIKRGQVKINEQELANKIQENKKLIAETKNEEERTGLIIAEKMLTKAQEAKTNEERATIVALRPYEIRLKEAQTDAQKAAAAASYASAAINQGLLDAGYCDSIVDQIVAQTEASRSVKKSNDAQKALNDFKLSIRNGTVFDSGLPVGPARQFVNDVAGQFFRIIAITGESLGGLSSAAGAAVGAAVGSSSGNDSPRTVVKGFGQ